MDYIKEITRMDEFRTNFKEQVIKNTDVNKGIILLDTIENVCDKGKRGLFLEGGYDMENIKLGKITTINFLDKGYRPFMELLEQYSVLDEIESLKKIVKKKCDKNNHFNLYSWNILYNDIIKGSKLNYKDRKTALYLSGYIQATAYKRKIEAIINKLK